MKSRHAEVAQRHHDVASHLPCLLRRLLDGAADHHLHQVLARQPGDIALEHHAPVLHHRDAIAVVEDFLQMVGNEDDADIALAQAVEKGEQAPALADGQGRGGLVEDEDARIGRQRLENVEDLLLAGAEVAALGVDIDVDIELAPERLRPAAQFPPVDQPEARRLASELDVWAPVSREMVMLCWCATETPAATASRTVR